VSVPAERRIFVLTEPEMYEWLLRETKCFPFRDQVEIRLIEA